LRVTIVVAITGIAYNVRNLALFINMVGAISGVMLAFILPIVFYWKSVDYKVPEWQYTFDVALIIISTGGASYALYSSL